MKTVFINVAIAWLYIVVFALSPIWIPLWFLWDGLMWLLDR